MKKQYLPPVYDESINRISLNMYDILFALKKRIFNMFVMAKRKKNREIKRLKKLK